jgi:F0F1-type ATP synthase epsilon subunit
LDTDIVSHLESGIIRLNEAENSKENIKMPASLGFIRIEPSV